MQLVLIGFVHCFALVLKSMAQFVLRTWMQTSVAAETLKCDVFWVGMTCKKVRAAV